MILKNARIVLEDKVLDKGYIIIEDDKIIEVGTSYLGEDGIDLDNKIIMPGFIDVHIHGLLNHDVIDGTEEAIKTMVENLPQEGTTTFLPTTLTVKTEDINKAVNNVTSCIDKFSGAKIGGVHLEGPFINPKHKGAQNESYITQGNKENYLKIGDTDVIKKMTYAVETSDIEFTRYLSSRGVTCSVGHSSASFDEVMKHVDAGLTSITHFHNGQSPHHHRTPGVVSAGFYSDDLITELIVDGVHLHPDTVKTCYKIKGKEGIYLITDSMSAKGMPNGNYKLGGLDVVKTDTEVRTESGSLAGSILSMNTAAKNMRNFTGCSLPELSYMTSINQAKSLGYTNVGKIKDGYIADLVVLTDDFSVTHTIVNGSIVYEKQ